MKDLMSGQSNSQGSYFNAMKKDHAPRFVVARKETIH